MSGTQLVHSEYTILRPKIKVTTKCTITGERMEGLTQTSKFLYPPSIIPKTGSQKVKGQGPEVM